MSYARPGSPPVTAPYVGTMHHVVQAMLRRANLRPGETLVDMGAGDGRIVVAAARDFGAQAIGLEQDPALVARANDAIAKEQLEATARIIEGDMLEFDLTGADVVTLFLNSHSNALVAPKLAQALAPGARVISYLFTLPGWLVHQSVIDPIGHRLHIYTIPDSLPATTRDSKE